MEKSPVDLISEFGVSRLEATELLDMARNNLEANRLNVRDIETQNPIRPAVLTLFTLKAKGQKCSNIKMECRKECVNVNSNGKVS